MSPEAYVPLLSAFAGAVIGSAGTVAAVWIQAWKEERRDQRELAFRLAMEQHGRHLEHVQRQGGALYPIDIYLAHSLALVRATESGPLTPEKLKAISSQLDPIEEYINERENVAKARGDAQGARQTPPDS